MKTLFTAYLLALFGQKAAADIKQFEFCYYQDCGEDSYCCGFSSEDQGTDDPDDVEFQNVLLCFPDSLSNGERSGIYIDDSGFEWSYECREEDNYQKQIDDDYYDDNQYDVEEAEETVYVVIAEKEAEYDVKNDYRPQDDWMEWVLWATYLSGFGWIFGYITYIPLGFFAYFIWIQWWDWVGFFQLFTGTDGWAYVSGPMRRFQVGFLVIYTIGLLTFWIPGLNFIMAPLLGYWAVMDYYDYQYVLPWEEVE